ncbi:MAG TPA: ferritin-like domain-containing protein [Nitrososphaerales archaeon]|nr:ferritin-like domain-containing protein [Nitrososphaerales archaeon]
MAEQLRQHASQELQHALLVAREIDYLGGEPSTEPFERQTSDNPKEMLQIDLRAEEKTIGNFSGRIKQAERAGKFAVSQVLRDIIVHEQDHAMDLKDALGIR